MLKVDPLNNFNNNINIGRSNLRANVNVNLTKTTKIATKYYSLFERYNGPTVSANDIFGMVLKRTLQTSQKCLTETKLPSTTTIRCLVTRKWWISNPYAEMVKGYKDPFLILLWPNFLLSKI